MTTDAPPPSAAPDKQALLGEFLRRIAAGEFNGDDKFHRFVEKEVFPLLAAGTLTGNDLKFLALEFSRVTQRDAAGTASNHLP